MGCGGAKPRVGTGADGEKKLGWLEPSPLEFTSPKTLGGGTKASAFKSSPEKCRGPRQSPFLKRLWGCQGEGEIGVLGQGRVTGLKEKGQVWGLGVLRREAKRMGNCQSPSSNLSPP